MAGSARQARRGADLWKPGWLRALLAAVLCAMAIGCSPEALEAFPPARPCEPTAPLPGDVTQTVNFSSDHMHCVDLTLPASDFELLRRQTRFEGPLFGAGLAWAAQCNTPLPEGYAWFTANSRINGVELRQVGLRKKGFIGSVVRTKPSLKIKTDRVRKGQKLGDTERITLNNSRQDPARMVTCLAYEVFAAAGHPAPRCNLANVMVNGTPLGPYVHVEAVKKAMLRRLFGEGGDAGSLYEGTVADFTDAHTAGFATGELGHWQAKTSDSDPSGAPLLAVLAALRVDDASLEQELGKVLNIKRFMTYWAVEVVVGHLDSYSAGANNFFVYFDPTDGKRAVFIPWGTDAVFNDDGGGGGKAALARFTSGEVARRLTQTPALRQRFDAELRRVIEDVWDPEALIKRIDSYAIQVKTAQNDPEYDTTVEGLRRWVRGRRARIEAWLMEGVPAGSASPNTCESSQLPFQTAAALKDIGFGL